MRKRHLLFICFSSVMQILLAQENETTDTIQSKGLTDVVVRAYEQNRSLTEVPGAVNYINRQSLSRYNNTNVLQAINATPGVRMEERSPGSYRLNIRGSSLRSPFGVRNVKIYYNDIPFTDPGGNTYLNQLGFYNFGSIEILKGPGSSLYGAGTGGVMLIESNSTFRQAGVNVAHTIGSYNLHNSNININTGNDSFRNIINYQHQSSDGYRDHSKLRRDVLSWEVSGGVNETDRLSATFLYGDMFYETPGALTLREYQQNRKAARPQIGTTPGANESAAAISQKTLLGGVSYHKGISSNWKNTTTLYGAFSRLDNPAIRNYARNSQPHFGGRSVFQFKKDYVQSSILWHTGAELQKGFSTVKIYRNRQGQADSIMSDDELDINTYFVFTQLTYNYKNWIAVAGLSYNKSKYGFTRFSTVPSNTFDLQFKNQVAPRISVLRKITDKISAYALWSKGFSPPTAEEVFPTGSLSNPGLSAEQGTNYEVGVKGFALNNKLSFDVSAFYFQLQNTIVQRRDAAGGDFYTNAGSTDQKGIETQINYKLFSNNINDNNATIFLSHSVFDFYYKDFKQVGNDFSGNPLPGIAKHFVTAGFDFRSSLGLYTNLTYQYIDPVPLDDANTSFSEAYNLLTARVGYRHTFKSINVDLFGGADNIFDVSYSLGNDINAFGGRFYNAAPGRNYFAGLAIGYSVQKKR